MKENSIFEKSRIIAGGVISDTSESDWTPHPSFPGVYMKHLVTGNSTSGSLSCHIVRVDPQHELSPHIHEGKIELHEVIDGDGRFTLGKETFDYSPGVVSIIPESIQHSVKAGENGLLLLAKFSPALI